MTLLLGIVGVSRQSYNKFFNLKQTSKEDQDELLKGRITYWYELNTKFIGTDTILTNLKSNPQVTM